jgi:hypothetical protein
MVQRRFREGSDGVQKGFKVLRRFRKVQRRFGEDSPFGTALDRLPPQC